MSTQPNPFSKPTLPQDRTPKQRSAPVSAGGAPSNLWMQSLILHAPLIGLGFGLATGLCLLMGISISILLSPDIHATSKVADQSATDQSFTDQSGANQSAPADGTDPDVRQTADSTVRIVVPATKSFQESFQGNTTTQGASPPSSKARTIGLLLGGGGLVLGGIGFWSLRWIRRQSAASGFSAATSTNAIVLHPNQTSALTSTLTPRTSPTLDPLETPSPQQTYLPPSIPPVLPASPGLTLDPAALTITYQTEQEPTIVFEDTRRETSPEFPPQGRSQPGEDFPSQTSDQSFTDLPTDLAHLMDIRKRRPHS